MLPKKIAFVDVETTGMRSILDRIIEVGILRIENNTIVASYNSLINPMQYVPEEICAMTGIKEDDLLRAPTFREVSYDISEILEDCVFIVHNARFDYTFLKNEFKRLGTAFSPKHCCTVKLSRTLFPSEKHHNLDSIIERFGLRCPRRHRAFDDASALWQFYQKIQTTFSRDELQYAMKRVMKRPAAPINLDISQLDELPESCGVYIFYGQEGAPLYVGKSINIRDRVLSHFARDCQSSIEMKIAQQVQRIETIVTPGELGAFIKESQLIKQLQPLYNRKLRLHRKLLIVKSKKNEEGYETLCIETADHIDPLESASIVGIFRSQKQAKSFLAQIAKEHNLCEKYLGIEKTKTSCFAYRLERCFGACIKAEKPIEYNARVSRAFAKTKIKAWPFKGPVIIEEVNELDDKGQAFVVDNWSLLGSITFDSGAEDTLLQEAGFDVDTYKILERFLLSEKNRNKIKLLQQRQFEKIKETLSDIGTNLITS